MEFYICVHRADSYLGDCMPTDLKTLVTGLYDLREPADPSERKKALKAAMAMLGDDTAVTDQKPQSRLMTKVMGTKVTTGRNIRSRRVSG
jgi:hypothetical protein